MYRGNESDGGLTNIQNFDGLSEYSACESPQHSNSRDDLDNYLAELAEAKGSGDNLQHIKRNIFAKRLRRGDSNDSIVESVSSNCTEETVDNIASTALNTPGLDLNKEQHDLYFTKAKLANLGEMKLQLQALLQTYISRLTAINANIEFLRDKLNRLLDSKTTFCNFANIEQNTIRKKRRKISPHKEYNRDHLLNFLEDCTEHSLPSKLNCSRNKYSHPPPEKENLFDDKECRSLERNREAHSQK